MEGKATFTLTNARTGETVRQFTEHNLVTDAVKRILAPPGYAIMNSFDWTSFITAALPLYKTLFGGIMLLGNNVPENAGNIMPTPDFIPVATAGDAYSGSLTTRGTLNLNETYATENGYHFTWDFGTDKANGTIKCAALTSRIFGNTGFGSDEKTGGLMMDPNTLTVVTPHSQYCKAKGQYICSISDRRHIYYELNSDMSLTFHVVRTVDPESLGINDSGALTEYIEPETVTTITLPITLEVYTKPFLDSTNGILYFFSEQYGEEGNRAVDSVGVRMSDFSLTAKQTWSIGGDHLRINAAALYDGSLYFGDGVKLYVYSSSGTLTKEYDLKTPPDTWFYMVNGVLYVNISNNTGWVLYNGEFVINTTAALYGFGTDQNILPPYYPMYIMERPHSIKVAISKNPYLGLAANYLATINNLSEPLVKTNEHTLKITYDIIN